MTIEGNAVGFTASNGSHSGVIVPGTGLHLNNMLGEEDLVAGRHLAPGNRLTSMQAPTMVERGGRLRDGRRVERLEPPALGDHAGDRERRPRTGCRSGRRCRSPACTSRATGSTARAGSTRRWWSELERWGERPVTFGGLNLYFGGANAVSVGADGSLDAAGDPRRDCYGIVL